ncbi:hypothetical protein BSA171_06050 [Bacillus safensis]|nr:hypothetical protein BSA41_11660 [Bacillus safensis]APT53160.1 hypothetical protein BSA171_06050 [Bacillus safensis]
MIDYMVLNSFLRLASHHEKTIDKFSAKYNQIFTTKRFLEDSGKLYLFYVYLYSLYVLLIGTYLQM